MNETNKDREKHNKLLPSYFYEENGCKVMTEEFHKQRGFCCGNGCRHCCYWPRHTKGATIIKTENE